MNVKVKFENITVEPFTEDMENLPHEYEVHVIRLTEFKHDELSGEEQDAAMKKTYKYIINRIKAVE